MGIVKLHLPRFIYHRVFLPTNLNWRSNTLLAAVQIYTITSLAYFACTRYKFQGPRNGVEYLDPNMKSSRIVKLL